MSPVREFLLTLAASGHRAPIGADLVLHQHENADEIRLHGPRLGMVICQAAATFRTPLAIPLINLKLEQADALQLACIESPYLVRPLSDADFEAASVRACKSAFLPAHRASLDAIAFVARQQNLLAMGMSIGPFSLMTRLLDDPAMSLARARRGGTNEGPDVALIESALRLAELAVQRSVRAQIRCGARAVIICEPAAGTAFLPARQNDSDLFERYVMQPNLRIRDEILAGSAEQMFHDCGELASWMVEAFAHRLHPAMLSLGSSRTLWEDAALVPDDVVLFGNLSTRNFASDEAMPDDRVAGLTRNLVIRMRRTGHRYILGSECEVQHVEDGAASIRRKVELMLRLPVN